MSFVFSLIFIISIAFVTATDQNYIRKTFENDATELIRYITKGKGVGLAYQWLSALVDGFGHRMIGSESLEQSIDFLVKSLKKDGFDDVHTEEVPNLPHWIRGDDVVELIKPRRQRLNVLAVGGCEPADITGEVVVIRDLDDAKQLNVNGKIVVTAQEFKGYFETVKYRRSAKLLKSLGAIGVLVKSITSFSINSPHTGSGAEGIGIPVACLTTEEASMIDRMYRRGREFPSEVILLTAHLDSWDVGQGAMDDAGGCAAIWSALHSLKQLGMTNDVFRPRRTIRGIFWTAEEQGFLGAKHYYNTHKNYANETFFFVSETDTGAFKPTNWLSHLAYSANMQQFERLNQIVSLLNINGLPIGLRNSSSQGDVRFWAFDGVPSVNYLPDKAVDYYFYFHHTDGDYITIFKDGDLEYTAAIFAVLGHVIANMDDWGNAMLAHTK
uniref:Carboxypeptidase Q n=1 Tax=Setaria digitata TaxID=48799 RepID=A0A915PXU5_9BILA